MNCEQVQSLLVAYLDGEVTPSEWTLIQAHLSYCTVCQQELTLLSTARSRVRSMLQRRAVHVAPERDAWRRLEASLPKVQVSFLPEAEQPSSKFETRFSRSRASKSYKNFGGVSMKKRSILSAMAGVVVLAILAVFVARNVTPASASAQQILERAYKAQTQVAPAQGIEHIRTESYENLEAGAEDQGTSTTFESYFDLGTGKFRMTVTDTKTGKVFYVSAHDGSNLYSQDGGKSPESVQVPLTVYRTPQDGSNMANQMPRRNNANADLKDTFERMRNDPNVQFVGEETWEDGRRVYVLRSEQEIKALTSGDTKEPPLGFVSIYFEVGTYKLAGSRVTLPKDGKEVLITSQRVLVNEILPAGTNVAWDLSDLQSLKFVDDPDGEHAAPIIISVRELVANTDAVYLLKTVPDGYKLEISVLAKQPANQPYFYNATYRNEAGDYFEIRIWPAKIDDVSWSDETYTTASGLVIYLIDAPGTTPEGTPRTFPGGLMETPEGVVYSVTGTMSREIFKAWVEELVLVK